MTSAGIPGSTGASSLSGRAAGSSTFIFPGFNLILPPQLPRPLWSFLGAILCVRVGVPIAPPCPLPVCLRVLGVVACVCGMLWLPVCLCASRSVWWFVTVSQLGQEPWRGGWEHPGLPVPSAKRLCPVVPVPRGSVASAHSRLSPSLLCPSASHRSRLPTLPGTVPGSHRVWGQPGQ